MKNATLEVRPAGPDAREERLDRLYQLIEDIEVAMLTTRRRDGSLVSRPMATQRRSEGAHFWSVTEEGSPKIGEIALDPNVNLSYYKARTKEWVSVSGSGRISRDRSKIRELYEPSWKVWFPDQGGSTQRRSRRSAHPADRNPGALGPLHEGRQTGTRDPFRVRSRARARRDAEAGRGRGDRGRGLAIARPHDPQPRRPPETSRLVREQSVDSGVHKDLETTRSVDRPTHDELEHPAVARASMRATSSL